MSTPQSISCKELTQEIALQIETQEPDFNFNFVRGKSIAARFRPEKPSDEVVAWASLMFSQIANWQDGNKDAVAEALKGIDIAAAWAYASSITSPHHPDEGEKVSLSEMKYFLIAN